jgi:hypothetical protein
MLNRRLAFAGILALLLPGLSPTPWSAAQSKERYLLAQVGTTVRGWVRIEGRRQANGMTSEEQATAAVRAHYPNLSPKDASTLAFVVLMVALRDVEADIRIPNPPITVMNELQARRERLMAIVLAMARRTPDYASPALRTLR